MRRAVPVLLVSVAISLLGLFPARGATHGESIVLEGQFARVWAYGPPNYGENPESDQVIRDYVLILKRPLTVTEAIDREEKKVTRIRLMPLGPKAKDVFSHTENGTMVMVSGTVRLAGLAIELESVLMDVADVSVRDPSSKE